MRIKDLNSNIPPLHPDYIILDAESFIFESKFTGEKIYRPYAERTLSLLSTSYNYISLFDKKQDSILNRIKSLFKQSKTPHYGSLIELPMDNWREFIEEYDTILLYYGNSSSERIFQILPENRRLKYSPDPRVLDVVISNYRMQHKIVKVSDREAINKTKRSNYRNRIQSNIRETKFEKKFNSID